MPEETKRCVGGKILQRQRCDLGQFLTGVCGKREKTLKRLTDNVKKSVDRATRKRSKETNRRKKKESRPSQRES